MLTRSSPSAITTRTICIGCGSSMPLRLVEPDYCGKRRDTHVFVCSGCERTEAYVFERT
jgi:predicted Fe-S protein YdhL (DUF1289 family)